MKLTRVEIIPIRTPAARPGCGLMLNDENIVRWRADRDESRVASRGGKP
jgi:hypothetical protein